MKVDPALSLKAALELLDTKAPGLKKTMGQDEVDLVVSAWKEHDLPKIYKARRVALHPDKEEGNEEDFKLLPEALEVVQEKLHLKAYAPPPAEVKRCRQCNTLRTPNDAQHCHECGLQYKRVAPRAECPSCDQVRNPTRAKFCSSCGYDFHEPDAFIERMRGMGFTENDITVLRGDGTIARWRKRGAFDRQLTQDMKFDLAKRKMGRGDKADFASIFGDLSGRKRGGFP